MQLTTLTELAFYAAAAIVVAVALAGLAAEQVRLYRIRQRLDRRVRSLTEDKMTAKCPHCKREALYIDKSNVYASPIDLYRENIEQHIGELATCGNCGEETTLRQRSRQRLDRRVRLRK